jgi:hypothetical protein
MNLHGIERDKVLLLAKDKEVYRSFAEELIKSSAYWYEHPSGTPVKAPNHSKHIYQTGTNNWEIEFGANAFSISSAVCRCQETLLKFFYDYEQGKEIDINEIKRILHFCVRECVENYKGDGYELYPVSYSNHMRFGATSICVTDFVNCILSKCQTFKDTSHQNFEICPKCLQKFKNKNDLNYHQQTSHFRRGR